VIERYSFSLEVNRVSCVGLRYRVYSNEVLPRSTGLLQISSHDPSTNLARVETTLEIGNDSIGNFHRRTNSCFFKLCTEHACAMTVPDIPVVLVSYMYIASLISLPVLAWSRCHNRISRVQLVPNQGFFYSTLGVKNER
jgi:hypothetical protein